MPTRLAVAIAMAAIANAAQMAFLWAATGPLPPPFVASHLILVTAVYAAIAVAVGPFRRKILWATLAFGLPVALALTEFVESLSGVAGVATLYGGTLLGAALWSMLPFAPSGSPIASGIAGAVVAAEFRRFVTDDFLGFSTDITALFVAVVVGLLGLATCLGGASLLRCRAAPSRWTLAGLTAAGWVVSAIATLGAGGDAIRPPVNLKGPTGAMPPMVVIVLDTLRADHTGLYGYERDTMPNLARFAADHGVVVERATSTSPWSLPTHASIFTGLYPPQHGAHRALLRNADDGPPFYGLSEDVPTLAELLSDAGYWTVSIAGNFIYLGSEYGLHRGFDHLDAEPSRIFVARKRSAWLFREAAEYPGAYLLEAIDRIPPFAGCEFFTGVPYRRASEITDAAIDAVETAGTQPFFLFLNFFDPHWPYYPPVEFRDAYPGRQRQFPLRGLEGEAASGRPADVLRGERDLTAEERAHVAALYDGEVRYMDHELGRLLSHLETHPSFEDMVVVITSDHGESFGEHRIFEHGASLYEPELKVPLVIKPGRSEETLPSGRIAGPMQSVDIFSTVLEHATVENSPHAEGSPWGRERGDSYGWLYVPGIPAKIAPERFRREIRSVEFEGWKLIESSAGSSELYNLRVDPGELQDEALSRSDLREGLRGKLQALPLSVRLGEPEASGISKEAMENLRALGYVQ